MIQPKELRIGNYVLDINNNITEVYSICSYGINLRGGDGNGVYPDDEIESINPIPLTEEWLLKLKITKWILGNTFEVRLNEDYGISIYAWQSGVSIFICHLYYVHQFQSWYYLHSKGQELTTNNL